MCSECKIRKFCSIRQGFQYGVKFACEQLKHLKANDPDLVEKLADPRAMQPLICDWALEADTKIEERCSQGSPLILRQAKMPAPF